MNQIDIVVTQGIAPSPFITCCTDPRKDLSPHAVTEEGAAIKHQMHFFDPATPPQMLLLLSQFDAFSPIASGMSRGAV